VSCAQAVDFESELEFKRGAEGRRMVEASAVRAASLYGFRHTEGDDALAVPALAVAGCEVDGVDAAVALSAALGAYLGGGSPDARAVRAGVTIACPVGGLVLFDLIDVDGDGVAVGVGYALDGDIDHIVVGRPDHTHAGEGAAEMGGLMGGGGKDIGRALIGARRAIMLKRADKDRLPADRHRGAEKVTCSRVRGLQLLLLAPDSAASHKDIGRTLIGARRAIIHRRADHDRLPADRHREAEHVTRPRVRALRLLPL